MNAGRISRIQVFEAKNMPGRQEAAVRVVRNGGIEGDRHCMDQEKQISIMWEDASRFVEEEEIKGLCFSRIKANLMIEGRMRLEVGDKIRAGSALLLITDRKGTCFDECGRYKTGMDCMLKDCCWFATALEDGEIRAGDLLTKTGSQEYDWQRYERQMMVPGMEREAQERLEKASVLVVGAGGLGCPVLTTLAEAGVGRIGIMDGDVVERSNLNRQYLYTPSDIGKKKAVCAGAWLQRFRPDIELEAWEERLTRENGKRIVSSFDLVICAVDKVKTRLLINRLAKEAGKPLIDGAIDGHYGTVTAVTGKQDPCLACMNPEGKEPVHISSSLGTTTMIVGALEAQLAVAYLAGQKRKGGSVLSYDGIYGTVEEIPVFKNPSCPICGGDDC